MKNLPQSSLTMFPENFAAMMILYNTVPNKSAVLLTFIVLLGLVMPLKGSIERGNSMGIIRVIIMLITSLLALISFIQSFIKARKARESK